MSPPDATGGPVLEAIDLHRRYRVSGGRTVTALAGVSLALARGTTLALVGESGSGKSTLTRLLLALERPDAGRVLLDGVDITGWSPRQLGPMRRRVQPVFQDPAASLDPRLRVGALLAEPLAIHRLAPRGERRARAAALLARVGLGPALLERYPHELSGGQRQRVSIARALAVEPEVLLLDEPVSALDLSVRAQILNLIMDLQDELGLTCLLVSHDLALVGHLATTVAVLLQGRLVERGPSAQVLGQPRHPYTRALLAAVPGGRPSERRLLRVGGDAPQPTAPPTDPATGCPFADRCAAGGPRCLEQPAAWQEEEDGHGVACHCRVPETKLAPGRGKRSG